MIASLSRVRPVASQIAGRRTAEGLQGTGRRAARGGLVAHVVEVIGSWWRTHGDRRQLSAMSDEMLRDVGLSRADVEREFQRPFWEPIDYGSLDEQRAIAARRSSFGLP